MGISRRGLVSGLAAAPLLATAAAARPAGMDEQGFVRIGGIDQWIAIQGRDRGNPALLYLHGGPAEAQSPFLAQFRPWEKDFTVINWDQRGSGRTFGRNGAATPDVTLKRIAADAADVAAYAARRLGKRKVILVGQSWGTVVGLTVLARRPDLFHAYVGTGQAVNWALSLKARESFVRAGAVAAHDAATLKALDATQALATTDSKRLAASNKGRFDAEDMDYLKRVQGAFIGPDPAKATGAGKDWLAGGDFSGPKLWPAVTSFDARDLNLDVGVPFFVIQGRDDHIVSFAAARALVAAVRAPQKAFIPIAGGHFACFSRPAAFVGALVKNVAPLARD